MTSTNNPETVRIKRKRSNAAPEALLLQYSKKQKVEDGQTSSTSSDFYYRLQSASNHQRLPSVQEHASYSQSSATSASNGSGSPGSAYTHPEARTFRLSNVKHDGRRTRDGTVPTFVETRQRQINAGTHPSIPPTNSQSIPSTQSFHLKRPGRNAAVKLSKNTTGIAQSTTSTQQSTDLANELHAFALDSLSPTTKPTTSPKPKITHLPKLPPNRSRDLHHQHATTSPTHTRSREVGPTDTSMDIDNPTDDDSEYVFDTYILTTNANNSDENITHLDPSGYIGYLLITDDDAALWETYLDDETSRSDDDRNSGEDEDENAEDWYGADYPDDELAEDDEMGIGAYGHRNGYGSDEEDGYRDEGVGSGDEESVMQPWRRKLGREWGGRIGGGDEEEREGGERNW